MASHCRFVRSHGRQATEHGMVEAHEEAVMAKIEPWLNKRDYRPADCPHKESIDVGEVASEHEIATCAIIAMACAFMFCGIDGTTHARCVSNTSSRLPCQHLALHFTHRPLSCRGVAERYDLQ